jgi:PhnB protein
MSIYTDVIVIPVIEERIDEYRRLSEMSQTIWLEHGALGYCEVQADDVKPGKLTSFPQSVDLKPGETVFLQISTYRSRADRDSIMAKVMKDPRFAAMDPKSVPFDMARMFFGGFKPFIGDTVSAPRAASAIQPYLFFRGRCEEAIEYYRAKLGAEVGMMMRFKDNPEKPGPDKVPATLDNRIMHAALSIHGSVILMSDGMKSGPLDFECMSLSLAVPTDADADRIFNALAADGKVQMPLGPTFFAHRFGAVADKFGVSWMILVPSNT